MRGLITEHALQFEAAPYPNFFEGETWKAYRVGTVRGLWNSDAENYLILSFVNDEQGNGHLNDVFQWFEHSAKREGLNIKILQIVNSRFYNHLINKRGFKKIEGTETDLIKIIV